MVVEAVETPAQLAALRQDCRRTGALLPDALAGAPAGPEIVTARTALDRYLALCRWYTLDVAVAGANAATAAGRAHTAVCRGHGFAAGTPTRRERELLRSWAATIRAALARGGDR